MIGSQIDELYEIRSQRISLEKQAAELKLQEDKLRYDVRRLMESVGLDKASGQTANFSIKKVVQPNVESWGEVYQFIKNNDAWPLLQQRLGATTWKEYMENGLLVPGTVAIEIVDYSLTKR